MSSVLRRSRDPQYLHLYRKCVTSHRAAMIDLAYCRYSECSWNVYEALEFFWKAIYFLQHGSYPQRHLPKVQDFTAISTFLGNYVATGTVNRIRRVYQRMNPSWQSNPNQRMRTRYGDELTRLPPSKIYTKKVAERSVSYASVIVKELVSINRKMIWQQPQLIIGILNGKFSRARNETKCNQAPSATGCGSSKWRRCLSRISRADPQQKAVTELTSSLCCVINPFGEAYPEKPTAPDTLPAYELIREYVYLGCVFVSCGGMPFTYYFNVAQPGNLVNLSTVVPNYPIALRLVTIQGAPQVQILQTTLLINNAVQRDFGLMPIMDDPASGCVGPIPLQVYQTTADSQFWTCGKVGNTFNLFRAADPVISQNVVPLLRARIQGREIYPISFARYGYGILFHIGLDLNINRTAECDLSRDAVQALLQNYLQFFA